MRNAYAFLAVLAAVWSGQALSQDRATVRMQPMVTRPPVLSRPAPPPRIAPAPAQRAPVVIGPLWNPKPAAPAPQAAPPSALQQQEAVQQESRLFNSTTNVLNTKRDVERNSIDNIK